MADNKPDVLEVPMPHLGDDATVSVEYREPTVAGLKELTKSRTTTELLAKHCEILLYVDGEQQPEGWWDNLPESVYIKMVMFMEQHRPLKPEEMKGSIVETLPLVWRL